MKKNSERTPCPRRQLAGLLYLLAAVAAFVSQALMTRVIVPDSAGATARNLDTLDSLQMWAWAINLMSAAMMVGAVVLVDEIVKPVSPRLSRIAAYAAVIGCGIQALLTVFLNGARILLDTPYDQAFYARQVQSLAHLLVSMYAGGYLVVVAFAGLYALSIWWIMATAEWSHVSVIWVVPMIAIAWIVASLPNLLGGAHDWAIGFVLYGQLLLALGLMAPTSDEIDGLVSWLNDRLARRSS